MNILYIYIHYIVMGFVMEIAKKIKHNGDFTRTIWYKAGHLTVRFQKSVATVFVRTPKNSKRGAV